MKISVPETRVAKARAQQASIGELKLGPIQVGQLSLSGVKLRTRTSTAQLRNLHLALTMSYSLDWRVGVVIDVPAPFPDLNISESGTMDLGTMKLGIPFGNLSLPGLADLSVDVPSLVARDLEVIAGALKNQNLGAALAEGIRTQGLVAPGQGFQTSGLGLASASAQGITLPDAALAGATIARVSGGTLPIGGLSIPGLDLPALKLPRLACENVGATSNPVVTKLPTADIGLLAATLKVTTTAQFTMDELRVDGVQAAASIGEIALKNIELPYEVLNVSLSQIGLEGIAIPQVEVK